MESQVGREEGARLSLTPASVFPIRAHISMTRGNSSEQVGSRKSPLSGKVSISDVTGSIHHPSLGVD